MLAVWLKTLSLFSASEKRHILLLFLCGLLVAAAQLVGIAAIMPFIAVLTSPELIETQPYLARLNATFGFASDRSFVIALGVFLFCVLVIGHALGLLYAWMSVRFANSKEYELSTALLRSYLDQDFERTSRRNTAELSKNVLEDVENLVSGILFSGLEVANSALSCLMVIGLLLFMDPWVTLTVAAVFLLWYGAIFRILSPRIRSLGAQVKDLYSRMYVSTQQGLDGLKEIKANDRESHFAREFASPRKASSLACIRVATLELVPKQLLEVMAFGSVIAVAVFFLYHAESPGLSYSLIAMFAFAAYRIIPLLKEVFDGLESIAYHRAYIDGIWDDLKRVQSTRHEVRHALPRLERIRCIELENVSYRYATQAEPALQDVNLKIEAGERVCLIGPSGAGKTTTIDVMLGLLSPQQGAVRVNGRLVKKEEYPVMRAHMGYVPQDPYLLDDTLANNIAFGEEPLDRACLATAYEAAGLVEVFGPFGDAVMQTAIGQYGSRLSGGERQRIAIARALYKRPDVLLLDESTNGLDLVTEKQFLDELARLNDVAIVFVSHRPSVMKTCDRLIVLANGKIVAQGSYEALSEQDARYRGLMVENISTTALLRTLTLPGSQNTASNE